jgi:hypothetical protein
VAYERRGFECYLQEWSLDEIGQVNDDPLTVIAELIYPRPRVSNRREIRTVSARLDNDWSEAAFHNRILFKELVEGPFSLGLTIKRSDPGSGFLGLVGQLIREAGGDSNEEEVDRFSPASLSATLEVMAESGFEQFDEVDFSDVVATGAVELNSSDVVSEGSLSVDLTAPVTIQNPEPNPHPERHSDYEEVLKQSGDANGTATLKYSIFDR